MKTTTLQKVILSLKHCIDLSEAIEMAESFLEDEKEMIVNAIMETKRNEIKYAMNISLLTNDDGVFENKNIGEAYYNMNFYKDLDFYPEVVDYENEENIVSELAHNKIKDSFLRSN